MLLEARLVGLTEKRRKRDCELAFPERECFGPGIKYNASPPSFAAKVLAEPFHVLEEWLDGG